MEVDIKAIIGGAFGGALGGALVLLIISVLSWVAINHRVSDLEKQGDESLKNTDSKNLKNRNVKGEKNEDDGHCEVHEPVSNREAAHAGAETGDLARSSFLMLERGLHVDTEDDHAMTLLQIASRHGHLDMVKLVINNGAAVEIDI